MESDILSRWCSERNRKLNLDAGVSSILSYGSDEINEYFTYAPLGIEVNHPGAKVPTEVIEALDFLYENKGKDWFACVTQIYSVPNGEWFGLLKSLRARRGEAANQARAKKRANRLINEIKVGERLVLLVQEEGFDNYAPIQVNTNTLVLTMRNHFTSISM